MAIGALEIAVPHHLYIHHWILELHPGDCSPTSSPDPSLAIGDPFWVLQPYICPVILHRVSEHRVGHRGLTLGARAPHQPHKVHQGPALGIGARTGDPDSVSALRPSPGARAPCQVTQTKHHCPLPGTIGPTLGIATHFGYHIVPAPLISCPAWISAGPSGIETSGTKMSPSSLIPFPNPGRGYCLHPPWEQDRAMFKKTLFVCLFSFQKNKLKMLGGISD